MSKITNDDLTQTGTVCFIVVSIWQLWASKGSRDDDTDRVECDRKILAGAWVRWAWERRRQRMVRAGWGCSRVVYDADVYWMSHERTASHSRYTASAIPRLERLCWNKTNYRRLPFTVQLEACSSMLLVACVCPVVVASSDEQKTNQKPRELNLLKTCYSCSLYRKMWNVTFVSFLQFHINWYLSCWILNHPKIHDFHQF